MRNKRYEIVENTPDGLTSRLIVRQYRVYVSPNIDLSIAKFDQDRIITEEDMKKN